MSQYSLAMHAKNISIYRPDIKKEYAQIQNTVQGESQALVSRKPTLAPKPLPILKKQIGKRHHADRQERQQARVPLIAKLPVHLHAKKWECR